MKGKLYLIPTTLGDSKVENVIPTYVLELINEINIYIVENVRTARRYLRKAGIKTPIDDLTFHVLDKRTKESELHSFLKEIKTQNIGLISEAGCPGVADPGASIAAIAHERGIQVIPLVGPSSILLAQMASGFNGQNFAFVGYIPVKKPERLKAIQRLEKRSAIENQTQIFIETPYRNMHLFDDILHSCNKKTRLCIASDITLETEFIKTKSIAAWKNSRPELHKRPTIFLIQAISSSEVVKW